ncbi:hypothetical protein PM082_014545 [Marasmius tenuissimus]|nr:hypothetical protein PM082_014545 [Marasmius tenuissimus]
MPALALLGSLDDIDISDVCVVTSVIDLEHWLLSQPAARTFPPKYINPTPSQFRPSFLSPFHHHLSQYHYTSPYSCNSLRDTRITIRIHRAQLSQVHWTTPMAPLQVIAKRDVW